MPKPNKKIDTHNTNVDISLSGLDTGTSLKRGGVTLVLWTQTSPLSEMIWSCKYKNVDIKVSVHNAILE
jgi:hypothetical protein